MIFVTRITSPPIRTSDIVDDQYSGPKRSCFVPLACHMNSRSDFVNSNTIHKNNRNDPGTGILRME